MKLITIAALALAFTASPLAAEPVSKTIATADLDLSSPEGQRALDRRLSRAIVELCGEASAIDLAGRNEVRACQVEARANAIAQRDSLLAARSGADIVLAAR